MATAGLFMFAEHAGPAALPLVGSETETLEEGWYKMSGIQTTTTNLITSIETVLLEEQQHYKSNATQQLEALFIIFIHVF